MWIFVLCRVEFSKIGKRDITFIREMRVDLDESRPMFNFDKSTFLKNEENEIIFQFSRVFLKINLHLCQDFKQFFLYWIILDKWVSRTLAQAINHTPKIQHPCFHWYFYHKHISLYALGRLKWILDIIWPLNQHFKMKKKLTKKEIEC